MKRNPLLPFAPMLHYQVIPQRGFPDLECWGCRSILDLHQPEEGRPDRFLGTCPNCGRWYRISLAEDEKSLVVLELPDGAQIAHSSNAPVNGSS